MHRPVSGTGPRTFVSSNILVKAVNKLKIRIVNYLQSQSIILLSDLGHAD